MFYFLTLFVNSVYLYKLFKTPYKLLKRFKFFNEWYALYATHHLKCVQHELSTLTFKFDSFAFYFNWMGFLLMRQPCIIVWASSVGYISFRVKITFPLWWCLDLFPSNTPFCLFRLWIWLFPVIPGSEFTRLCSSLQEYLLKESKSLNMWLAGWN